jgi:multiple sugar transport system ATP-binding protein
MARVALENLTKTYPAPGAGTVRAVENLNLVVEDNELVVLVGPSGCGKTTTLRLIAGLEEPTAGVVAIDGRVVNGVAPKDRDIAMVFQHFALYPHLTVQENLAFGLKLRKCPRKEMETRVRETAKALDLEACLSRRPREISGGQRQRVALGRAMVRQPKVFLFDEPLSNLDAQMRALMRTELARLHARLATTMIYVTHDQVEAMMLGQRIAVMKDGILQQVGDPLHVYHHPANRFVAGFLGSPPMNFFQGRISRRTDALFFEEQLGPEPGAAGALVLRIPEGIATRLNGHSGQSVLLGIRPEHIARTAEPSDVPPGQLAECVVEVVQPMGPQTCLTLATAAHRFVACVPASDRPRVAQKVFLAFDMTHARFFDPAAGNAIT